MIIEHLPAQGTRFIMAEGADPGLDERHVSGLPMQEADQAGIEHRYGWVARVEAMLGILRTLIPVIGQSIELRLEALLEKPCPARLLEYPLLTVGGTVEAAHFSLDPAGQAIADIGQLAIEHSGRRLGKVQAGRQGTAQCQANFNVVDREPQVGVADVVQRIQGWQCLAAVQRIFAQLAQTGDAVGNSLHFMAPIQPLVKPQQLTAAPLVIQRLPGKTVGHDLDLQRGKHIGPGIAAGVGKTARNVIEVVAQHFILRCQFEQVPHPSGQVRGIDLRRLRALQGAQGDEQWAVTLTVEQVLP
ncbi:hypothetical protein D9M71_307730 [compost metagenome]